MQVTLTPEDRAAIDAAEAVMRKYHTGPVAALSLSMNRLSVSASAHDQHEAFCSAYSRKATLADRLQDALNQVHSANPDEEARKAKRIAELREQLSRLEGEAA